MPTYRQFSVLIPSDICPGCGRAAPTVLADRVRENPANCEHYTGPLTPDNTIDPATIAVLVLLAISRGLGEEMFGDVHGLSVEMGPSVTILPGQRSETN